MEQVEAASRCGEPELAAAALRNLRERTQNGGTDWALGTEACWSALVNDGESAEASYIEAIERLGHCRMRMYLARSHLLFGEWLRRERRHIDAREQLSLACEMFGTFGAHTFGKRAHAELLAAGGSAPTSNDRSFNALTSQEARVASLASEGLTNQQVAAQLFLSPYTVDYHLRKVFRKFNVKTRAELRVRLGTGSS
jgi:DNA-binding CsgD family transcriptional regulator